MGATLRCHLRSPSEFLLRKRAAYHYCVVTWASRRLELTATRLFVQYLAHISNKENLKYLPSVRGVHQRHRTSVCMSCRHHHKSSHQQCQYLSVMGTFATPVGWGYIIVARNTLWHKQRVLMHRHQGLNVRHGLCHIYMRYLYIYELFIAFVCFVVCSLL